MSALLPDLWRIAACLAALSILQYTALFVGLRAWKLWRHKEGRKG